MEFRVPVGCRAARRNRDEGRIGNEIRHFGRMLSIRARKLGRLTVKFAPARKSTLYRAALGTGTSD